MSVVGNVSATVHTILPARALMCGPLPSAGAYGLRTGCARVEERMRNNLGSARTFLCKIGFEGIKTGSDNKFIARPHVYPSLARVDCNK